MGLGCCACGAPHAATVCAIIAERRRDATGVAADRTVRIEAPCALVLLAVGAVTSAASLACDRESASRPTQRVTVSLTPAPTYPPLPLDYREGEVSIEYRVELLPSDEQGQAWNRVTIDGVLVDVPAAPWRSQPIPNLCSGARGWLLVLQHDATGDRIAVDMADKRVAAVSSDRPERLAPLIDRVQRSFAGDRIVPPVLRGSLPLPTIGPCDPDTVPTLPAEPTPPPWPAATPEPWPFERITIEGVSVEVPTGPEWRGIAEADPCASDGRRRYVLEHAPTGVIVVVDMGDKTVSATYEDGSKATWLGWLMGRILLSFVGEREIPPDVVSALPLPTSPACEPHFP